MHEKQIKINNICTFLKKKTIFFSFGFVWRIEENEKFFVPHLSIILSQHIKYFWRYIYLCDSLLFFHLFFKFVYFYIELQKGKKQTAENEVCIKKKFVIAIVCNDNYFFGLTSEVKWLEITCGRLNCESSGRII